ncbi:MAG: ATP-binding protein [Clostridium sp.]|nr:ATP-binding protein [Clostridium sp.]
MDEFLTTANEDNLDAVYEFINAKLDVVECLPQTRMEIELAVEEIFVNITSYAYRPDEGPVTIQVTVEDTPIRVILTFIDNGKPFDPLAKKDADATLPPEEREIGGLGIFLVKKTMDSVKYEYKDGQNILTVVKNV